MGAPNTKLIASSVQSLLQALTYNSAPLYKLVKLGEVQDATDLIPYAAITFLNRKTARFDSGWKLNSTPVLQIESAVDMTDSTLAEQTIMDIADMLTSLFAARYQLNNVQGVYVTLTDQDDRTAYRAFPNGRVYRIHQCYVKCNDQYNVTLQP